MTNEFDPSTLASPVRDSLRLGSPPTVREYLGHYHGERNHQGLDNELIDPGEEIGAVAAKITCRKRLGGMLRYYYRDAA